MFSKVKYDAYMYLVNCVHYKCDIDWDQNDLRQLKKYILLDSKGRDRKNTRQRRRRLLEKIDSKYENKGI